MARNHEHEVEKKEVLVEKPDGDEDIIWVTEFDEDSAKKFCEAVLKQSANDPKKPIVVYIDSFGGMVDALSAMISTLDRVSNKIITVAMGKAMSCGAMLLSHGDVRYVAPHCRVMVHEISAGAFGNVNDMKTRTDEIDRCNQHWMGWLAKNCNVALKQFLKLFTNKKRDIYLSADEAVKFGIADKVGIPLLKRVVRYEVE